MGVAVGLRRGSRVFARPRGSGLFRWMLRLILFSRVLRLTWPRGRFVVADIFRY
jgi:hypothetical protein